MDSTWEMEIANDMFLGLTTYGADAKPVPGAAESWTVSADGLVWTFKLRAGLAWSDGTPFTAADFAYSFRRLMDPKTAAKYASIQYVIKNAAAVNSGKMPLESLGVRAPDDRTVEITLEAPTPYLPGLMAHTTAAAGARACDPPLRRRVGQARADGLQWGVRPHGRQPA